MDSKHDHPQPTEPVWNERHGDAEVIRLLKQRISELEGEIEAYNELLAELPDVFERRFQQRLEPLMERYQLLAEQVDQDQIERPQPALPGSSEPDNVVRFPGLRLEASQLPAETAALSLNGAGTLTRGGSADPRRR